MPNVIEVRVPDIGDYKDVEIIEVAVQPGDAVAVDGTLITLETEKATMDVPSTAAGIVRELKVRRGGRVSFAACEFHVGDRLVLAASGVFAAWAPRAA